MGKLKDETLKTVKVSGTVGSVLASRALFPSKWLFKVFSSEQPAAVELRIPEQISGDSETTQLLRVAAYAARQTLCVRLFTEQNGSD